MSRHDRSPLWRTGALTAATSGVAGAVAASMTRDAGRTFLAALLGANLGLAAENQLRLAALGRSTNQVADRVERSDELRPAVDRLSEEVHSIRTALQRRDEALARRVDLAQFEKRSTKRADSDRRQVEMATQLALLLRPTRPVPATGGWALSADTLGLIVGVILAERPGLIVECGSGTSSLWLGYALRRSGAGRLVALEHDEAFADRTEALVDAHDLADVVEIRHAPLEKQQVGEGTHPWYARRAWQGLASIDLLLVDGPPRRTGPAARYPAIGLLGRRLAPGATVVLDDAKREDERAVFARWTAELGVQGELREDLDKGVGFLRLPG
jgi:predicted O-methyltransferase YrrM